jgi:hypothetical protein
VRRCGRVGKFLALRQYKVLVLRVRAGPTKAETTNPAAVDLAKQIAVGGAFFPWPRRLQCNPGGLHFAGFVRGSMQIAKGFRNALERKISKSTRSVGPKFHGIRIAKGSYPKFVSMFRSKRRVDLSEEISSHSLNKEVVFGSL